MCCTLDEVFLKLYASYTGILYLRTTINNESRNCYFFLSLETGLRVLARLESLSLVEHGTACMHQHIQLEIARAGRSEC